MGLSLLDAVELGWIDCKHSKTQAFKQLLVEMPGTSRQMGGKFNSNYCMTTPHLDNNKLHLDRFILDYPD
ncbi:hypothetical protein BJP37_24700 [Moorena bouillonii PNG]|uniref:Uncharacterized protein n=2 Tax=Moorena TaxID=1155738 RepID=A0A1U7N729_9CYAN|nr:hypothetical protein [Moorena bouillonii]OLT61748.1 hypothetical protein BJP37_24700 [Moorena bouillonii PNG]